ncbi:MAG: hypothetical protein ACKN85_09860 [Pirellula sp.]
MGTRLIGTRLIGTGLVSTRLVSTGLVYVRFILGRGVHILVIFARCITWLTAIGITLVAVGIFWRFGRIVGSCIPVG